MKKLKRNIQVLALAIFSVSFFSHCDEMDKEDDGREAGKEFCDCLDEGYTVSKCEEKLRDKHSRSTLINKEFRDGFNEAADACDIRLDLIED